VESDSDQAAPRSKGPQMRTNRPVLAGIVALLMTGCGGKIRYPSYYTLEIPSPPKPPAGDAIVAATVAVRRFETPPYLRQGRLVYRETPQQIGFYEYRRWASDPAASITDAMIDSIRSARLFSFVKLYDGQDKPDYVMSGRLERLDEIDYGESVRVEAKLSADLVNTRTGATVWSESASSVFKVDTRDVQSVVAEMSHAVEQTIGQLVGNLTGRVQTMNSENSSSAGRPD
jgi:ABC-type uncharacterized transport system auxiliary subunit